jgi:hypothetical protein
MTTSKERHAIQRSSDAGHSAGKIAAKPIGERKLELSKSTVERIIKGGNIPRVYGQVPTTRRLGAKNKKARLAFCKRFVKEYQPKERPWVFMDGKVGSEAWAKTKRMQIYVHVWACMLCEAVYA